MPFVITPGGNSSIPSRRRTVGALDSTASSTGPASGAVSRSAWSPAPEPSERSAMYAGTGLASSPARILFENWAARRRNVEVLPLPGAPVSRTSRCDPDAAHFSSDRSTGTTCPAVSARSSRVAAVGFRSPVEARRRM